MSLTGWVARCDVDGCDHDAYWRVTATTGVRVYRVDCPAHPADWPSTPLNDPARPPALKETA